MPGCRCWLCSRDADDACQAPRCQAAGASCDQCSNRCTSTAAQRWRLPSAPGCLAVQAHQCPGTNTHTPAPASAPSPPTAGTWACPAAGPAVGSSPPHGLQAQRGTVQGHVSSAPAGPRGQVHSASGRMQGRRHGKESNAIRAQQPSKSSSSSRTAVQHCQQPHQQNSPGRNPAQQQQQQPRCRAALPTPAPTEQPWQKTSPAAAAEPSPGAAQ